MGATVVVLPIIHVSNTTFYFITEVFHSIKISHEHGEAEGRGGEGGT